MSSPFWRAAPFSDEEYDLLCKVKQAHYDSSFRNSLSKQCVEMAALGSGDYVKSITAGLMTLGGLHAPLAPTMEFLALHRPADLVEEIVQAKERVPGWGNSFIKGMPDASWHEVDVHIGLYWPEMYENIIAVTEALEKQGYHLFPNPACYTAATALIIKMPASISPIMFISGRLAAWSEIFLGCSRRNKTEKQNG